MSLGPHPVLVDRSDSFDAPLADAYDASMTTEKTMTDSSGPYRHGIQDTSEDPWIETS